MEEKYNIIPRNPSYRIKPKSALISPEKGLRSLLLCINISIYTTDESPITNRSCEQTLPLHGTPANEHFLFCLFIVRAVCFHRVRVCDRQFNLPNLTISYGYHGLELHRLTFRTIIRADRTPINSWIQEGGHETGFFFRIDSSFFNCL